MVKLTKDLETDFFLSSYFIQFQKQTIIIIQYNMIDKFLKQRKSFLLDLV